MAREALILKFCDGDHDPDARVTATVERVIAVDHSHPMMLDLCEACDAQFVQVVVDLMERGIPESMIHKQKYGRGMGRPPKETPGPHICPLCHSKHASRSALGHHLRSQHDSGLKAAGV